MPFSEDKMSWYAFFSEYDMQSSEDNMSQYTIFQCHLLEKTCLLKITCLDVLLPEDNMPLYAIFWR